MDRLVGQAAGLLARGQAKLLRRQSGGAKSRAPPPPSEPPPAAPQQLVDRQQAKPPASKIKPGAQIDLAKAKQSLHNASAAKQQQPPAASLGSPQERAAAAAAQKEKLSSNSQQQSEGASDCLGPLTRNRLATLSQIGEDWLYLALLGIIMALLSFSMDSMITLFLNTRLWLSQETAGHNLLVQYLAWCVTPVLLVTFSTGFVHLCSPTAIGSGIPEMKTILRGVVLNEYLTFRTLVAKIVGLTFTLGSGLPLGKEGPSVHVASIVATLLSKLVASFQGIYENESRTSEMLSAACAVGVAATFYAPIGGVLFSIEVATVYFAVRNYWRGFFAACCGATVWRLLGFWIKNDESISALFKTNFNTDYPFDPVELLVFSFIGATCGLAGAAYIKFHREIVQFFRRHERISGFLQQNRFVYPTLVTLIITSSTFPPFIGKYTASTVSMAKLSTHTTIEHLFSNRTWGLGKQDLGAKSILDHWSTPSSGFHLHLVLYIVMLFWTSALASTIPTPSGVFIPVLKMGAAYGRLLGELMAAAYPEGIKYSHPAAIVPGSYAVVGAAAFSGAVTHTVSTSVILFEMTGQIVHIIPVILGVFISNAVCQSLQPSIYDSIIEIKKLPYLPPIASSSSVSHRILVRDFMNTNIPFVWKNKCSYADLKALLAAHKKIMSFPLVESPQSMWLLGSIARPDLLRLLYMHLGRERRLQEVFRRNSDTLSPAIHLLTTISGQLEAGGQPAGDKTQLRRSESAPQHSSTPSQCLASACLEPPKALELPLGGSAAAAPITPSSATDKPSGTRFIMSTEREPANEIVQTQEAPDERTGVKRNSLESVPSEASGDQVVGEQQQQAAVPREVQSIARMINHYNRGSSMDDERLDKSIQEVESQLANEDESPPEVVVVVSKAGAGKQVAENSGQAGERQRKLAVATLDRGQPADSGVPQLASSSLAPNESLRADFVQLTTSNTTFSLHIPSSPAPNSRPTKSILKTSSFNGVPTRYYDCAPSLPSGEQSDRRQAKQQLLSNLKFSLESPSGAAKSRLSMGKQAEASAMRAPNQVGKHNFVIGDVQSSTNTDGGSSTPSPTQADELFANSLGAVQQQGAPMARQQQQQQQARLTRRKVRLPRLRVIDMTPEEQAQWEKEQLTGSYIDITKCQIDEAPFQLVQQTSLYRVHTLFSMLGLNHAYVTSFGRLVGIVALKDIRHALERMLHEK